MRQDLLGDGRQTRPRARAWTGGDAPTRDGGRADEVSAGNKLDAFSVPHMAEIVAPLRALMEHRLKGTSRTRSVASRRALTDGDWTPGRVEAWDNSRDMLMNAVELRFRRLDDCRVWMSPNASDLFWGCCLTQVPKEELVAGLSFMDMSHEPRAPRFPEWCISGIKAVLAHGGQGILLNFERFSGRAVLAVG